MKILHFEGEGMGWMAGVREYIVISDDPDAPDEDWKAPGFELTSVTELEDDLPINLPLNKTLVPRE